MEISLSSIERQCINEYENGTLIISSDKCENCEYRNDCRFIKEAVEAMNDMVYGY